MKVLFVGDVVGRNARNFVQKKIIELKAQLKLDAIIVNVENAAGGFGVTPLICDDFFNAGADILTTGNHIWDKREIISYISKNDRLLRPMNMIEGTPGVGITSIKIDAGIIGVANVMTNLFMSRTDPVFNKIPEIINSFRLSANVDFALVDVHGEASSEKMAIGYALDGNVSAVVGTHTHVPTADYQILEKGTAYITDVGMSGDYNSIIGMNKEDALNRFMFPNDKKSKLEVSLGEPTLCGVIIESHTNGLSKSIKPLRLGGRLEQTIL
ncbi:MAG: YmdB family metallophosphoesterase [Alphaproteobacteria bacterium]|jgi:metallophosphoesterase (TIGR00282 family)|nr:YmdB family metallophosphoesterase [Alphaproteobacteria bacterium]